MAWIEFDESYVLAAMPSEMEAPYGTWITDPGKTGRLAEIVGSVLADFRTGLSANPNVAIDSASGTLPERCLQHALTIVFYHLGLEMGLSVNMSAQTAFINAETYLRQLYTSDAVVDGEEVGETPWYGPAADRPARTLA